MNALRKLFGKKESVHQGDEYDYETEHVAVDFDKQFEEARRTSAVIPQVVGSSSGHKNSGGGYRSSPSRTSKSPSPYSAPPPRTTPRSPKPTKKSSASTVRKGSDPIRLIPSGPKTQITRKLTESQQRAAKDIVESLDWVKPVQPVAQVCYAASAQPLMAQAELITPQIHVCEMLPIPSHCPQMAVAVIPQNKGTLVHPQRGSLAATGKLVVPGHQ